MKTLTNLLLCMILFQINCKDRHTDCYDEGTCPPENYRYKLGGLKNYIWANTGSYWIYKHSKTGELDTQTVTSFYFDSAVSRGTEDYSKHITIKYDVLSRVIKSTAYNLTFSDNTSGYEANATPLTKDSTFNLKRYAGGFQLMWVLCYPFVKDKFAGNGASFVKFKSMDSTMVVQGKTYFDVAKLDIDFDVFDEKGCQYIPVTTYYWAKNVGLIKKTVNNCNFSWELIEYNIIK